MASFRTRSSDMSLFGNLFRTTIGRKFLMALSGVIMIGFVIGHLVGNLQVFAPSDHINGYAHFLQSLGPTLIVARVILLLSAVIHIWAGTMLAIEDRAARGSVPYKKNNWLAATLSSRYMRWTGYVVLAFLIYHLAQFTWGVTSTASYKEHLPHYTMSEDYRIFGMTAVKGGTQVLDVHDMVILAFQSPVVSIFYIFAIGLLSLHLLHGTQSLFQTFGWRNGGWAAALRAVVTAACVLYFIGNLVIPGAVLAGYLKTHG
jgi:succinate dehydrogenase / fumarate reductase cytochrome b subunit